MAEQITTAFCIPATVDSIVTYARPAGSPEALETAKKAQREREARLAAEKWIEDARFNMALKTFEVVRILETQRDDNTPKTPDEPWTAPFCQAIESLPVAEQIAQDAWFGCVKKVGEEK